MALRLFSQSFDLDLRIFVRSASLLGCDTQRWIDRDGGRPNHDGSEAGLNTIYLPQRRGLLRNTFADDSKMGKKNLCYASYHIV
ncbi:hypothetical protein WN943_008933 [Citrus x changshan-huyou]